MASNIEIKAGLPDPQRTRELVEQIAEGEPVILHQRDTFFPCAHGRLKLRELSPDYGELIFYQRTDTADAKRSDYVISVTTSPAVLLAALSGALGTAQIVRKTRTLFLVGQTRIHLDEVDSLGSFIELEVVLHPDQSAVEGQEIARKLMKTLEIQEDRLIACAYADLLAISPEADRAPD